MSMVKLQIRKLRECARKYSHGEYVSESTVSKILNEAADTIESLSAKLQAANMERSADLEAILEEIRGNIFSVEVAEFETESVVLLDDVEEIMRSHITEPYHEP